MRRTATLAVSILFAVAPLQASEATWILQPSDGVPLALPKLSSALPSPAEILGHRLGERFTHHEAVVRYMHQLAASSDRAALWEYGRTYEDRPLLLMAISSPANIRRLEDLRHQQVARSQAQSQTNGDLQTVTADLPIFVWLSYGIHGNESSSTEAAMAAAFVLAAAEGEWEAWLDSAVVLIDPLTNPDGRERYVHSLEARSSRSPDPYAGAAEHHEPWPGGRQNHYLIDLNRDWAWATQQETMYRLREYGRWEPHVYVDFHEMSALSTYFFPPAAEPIHPSIDNSTVKWLEVFGRANAQAFDEAGWVYYVGEKFDLFYPGYGDTYPALRAAIGMTYEMAGGGRAGLAIARPDKSLLTLSDRVARHLTTTLATVKTAIAHRPDIIADFAANRHRAATENIRTYLWEADQAEARAAAELLEVHGLQLHRLTKPQTIDVSDLVAGETSRRRFPGGTYALTTAQPLARVAQSLMEQSAPMPPDFLQEQRRRLEQNRSTEFYDITAWSIPLAFNLQAFVTASSVDVVPDGNAETPSIDGVGRLGFLVRPQGLAGYRLASALLTHGISLRLALADLDHADGNYPRGTLFIPVRGNPDTLEGLLGDLAQSVGVEIDRVQSGLAASGVSLGSESMVPLRLPVIGLLRGDGIRPTSFGFLWYLLDRQLDVPFHQLDSGSLERTDLKDFDVLVMPGGRGYEAALSDGVAERIGRWVDDGGVLIAIGEAVSWLAAHEMTSVEAWEPPADETTPANQVADLTPARRDISTPGAALATSLAPSHPLTVGLATPPALLFQGSTILLPSGDPQRDLVIARQEQPIVAGFAWPEVEERLRGALLVGIERRERGALVVLAQDPVFRLFWRATAQPFLNALLYAPSLDEYGVLFE